MKNEFQKHFDFFEYLLFSFEEIFNDASEEGLYFYSRGFDDFSLCLFFLRDSSNVPQVLQLPLETR